MSEEHESFADQSPFQQPPDGRVSDLVNLYEQFSSFLKNQTDLAKDPTRVAGSEWLRLNQASHIQYGRVVYAMPYTNCYRVQLDSAAGEVPCCAFGDGSFAPFGVRPTSMFLPNSDVLVYVPKGLTYGIILGSFPGLVFDPNIFLPTFTCAGSGAGFQREDAFQIPMTQTEDGGGMIDFSCGRPLDQTILDWGRVAETGVGIHVDPFLTFMRVNEACGIWFNYFDSHSKFAGIQMDIESIMHEISCRDDEGEAQLFEGRATYIWEALGAFAPGEKVFQEYSDEDVQFDKHVAKIDLPEDKPDIQPIYRHQAHGGYLGQGDRRVVLVPGSTSGLQLFSDDPREAPDLGVFEETVSLDGSWTVRSAKQIIIGKRVLIPVPKRIRLPEDQKEGDSKEKDNYKFAGQFGGKTPHRVGDIQITEALVPHFQTVAGVMDILAYHYNWKGLHPFHYHEGDYVVPEEAILGESGGGPTVAQDKLVFGILSSDFHLPPPVPTPVEVDHRYGNVDYFARESFLTMLPDGGIVLGDGYGAQITMAGGHVRIDCPGDFLMAPGRSIVGLGGDDIVLRAHNSVDISAGKHDVRLKAANNMQLVSGVDGQGGMLLEDKSLGPALDFRGNIGEDVLSSGIILKSKNAAILAYAGEIYLRTGQSGNPLQSGKITLDASQGNNNVVLKGSSVEAFCQSEFKIGIGPTAESDAVNASHVFGSSVRLSGKLEALGLVCATQGIDAGGSIQTTGSLGSPSGEVDQIQRGPLANRIATCEENVSADQKALQGRHKSLFPDDLYQAPTGFGDDKLIESIEFSFRDDPAQEQYGTKDFRLIESRWQQMVRLGMGTGGTAWDERTLEHSEGPQLPWPGKKKWEDEETLLQLSELTMFDADKRHSKDREDGPYEEPKFGTLNRVKPKDEFKVII